MMRERNEEASKNSDDETEEERGEEVEMRIDKEGDDERDIEKIKYEV